MRLTVRTNLALRTLMACAVNPGALIRKSEIAEAVNASENHLAQVINQLGQAGFLTTHRGRHGGIELARAPAQINIGEVFRCFEGDTPFVECFGPDNACPLSGNCRLGAHMVRALDAFYAVLDAVTLDDLVDCNTGLESLLALDGQASMGAAAGCAARRRSLARV